VDVDELSATLSQDTSTYGTALLLSTQERSDLMQLLRLVRKLDEHVRDNQRNALEKVEKKKGVLRISNTTLSHNNSRTPNFHGFHRYVLDFVASYTDYAEDPAIWT
jgi:hypothetical protein